jgi:2-phosphosulfolactate phosphatase
MVRLRLWLGLQLGCLILTAQRGARRVEPRGTAALVVACLRNRRSAADFLARALRAEPDAGVTIVACGEHWSSVTDAQGIRPGLEDWLGAGALAARLAESGASLSPEAKAAASFDSVARDGLGDWLRASVGGRELVAKGFPADVDLAAELDVSEVVPLNDASDGFFRPASASPTAEP